MQIQTFQFGPTDDMPNSALPLLFARQVFAGAAGDERQIEAVVRSRGWGGTWVLHVFNYWHYHTRGHELLVCVRGRGLVGFGGETGETVELTPGDAVLIPAGVGHKGLARSGGFAVLGAYPPGQDGTIVRAGEKDLAAARNEIARLELPQTDPLTGEQPGSLAAWPRAGET